MRGDLSVPSGLVPFVPLVSPSQFLVVWLVLLSLGVVMVGWFFIYEVSVPTKRRAIMMEVALATASSAFLSFGTIFLMLWSGVWV